MTEQYLDITNPLRIPKEYKPELVHPNDIMVETVEQTFAKVLFKNSCFKSLSMLKYKSYLKLKFSLFLRHASKIL